MFRFMHMEMCDNNKEKEVINLRGSRGHGEVGSRRHGGLGGVDMGGVKGRKVKERNGLIIF